MRVVSRPYAFVDTVVPSCLVMLNCKDRATPSCDILLWTPEAWRSISPIRCCEASSPIMTANSPTVPINHFALLSGAISLPNMHPQQSSLCLSTTSRATGHNPLTTYLLPSDVGRGSISSDRQVVCQRSLAPQPRQNSLMAPAEDACSISV